MVVRRHHQKCVRAATASDLTNGDPNTQRLPHWLTFDTNARAVMILDQQSRVEHDPDAKIQAFWASMPFVANIYW